MATTSFLPIVSIIAIIATRNHQVSAVGSLNCYTGTVYDLATSTTTLTAASGCLYCMRIKVAVTAGQAQSLVLSNLPGVGVSFWICALPLTFSTGVPIADGILNNIAAYIDMINNKYTCIDSTIVMVPKTAGRITMCSCCTDYCNNDYTQCQTDNTTSLSTVLVTGLNAVSSGLQAAASISAASAGVNTAVSNTLQAVASLSAVASGQTLSDTSAFSGNTLYGVPGTKLYADGNRPSPCYALIFQSSTILPAIVSTVLYAK